MCLSEIYESAQLCSLSFFPFLLLKESLTYMCKWPLHSIRNTIWSKYVKLHSVTGDSWRSDSVGNSSAIADSQSCRRQLSSIPHCTFTSLTKLSKDDCKDLGTVYLEWNFHVNISDLLLICRVIWENMILLYKVYIRLNKITAAIIHCSILRAKFCGMFVIFTKTVI